MPFPQNDFVLHGGCGCKAVRYRVSVPAFNERVPSPYRTPDAVIEDVRIPMSVICHCNDCRRSIGQPVVHALIADMKTVEFSSASRTAEPEAMGLDNRQWIPGDDILDSENPALKDLWLSLFISSPKRNRWFCGRCGTNLGYTMDRDALPKEWGWPRMMDIWTGTLDREILDSGWAKPDRSLWTAMGIPWIRDQVKYGLKDMPEHPLFAMNRIMGDDISQDLLHSNLDLTVTIEK